MPVIELLYVMLQGVFVDDVHSENPAETLEENYFG